MPEIRRATRAALVLFPVLVLWTAVFAGVWSSPVLAQTASLGGGDGPLEVEADEGIELRQEERVVIARGNARAIQDGVTLDADVIAASYREGADGRNEVHRIDAIGNVVIRSAEETIYGENAVYDLDQELMQVTGDNLRLVTPEQTITARDSLEYWRLEERAIARGDALAVREEQHLRADVLEALLRSEEEAAGKQPSSAAGVESSRIERIRAWGNVLISSPTEIAQGDRGDYDLDTEIATLVGNVRVTRGENQLDGQRAQVNMKTGVSRMLTDTGAERQRVRGVFFPGSDDDEETGPPEPGRPAERGEPRRPPAGASEDGPPPPASTTPPRVR